MRKALLLLALLARPLAAQWPDSVRTDTVPVLAPINVVGAREVRSPYALPLATTRVLPETRLGERGVGIDEALQFVPGVLAQSRYGGSDVRLVIRGFGARGAGDRSNAGTSRGVRVLLDGVPETEPDGRTAFDNLDLGLMRGIEVVRSNASPLWGNAAGGVVSFTTLDPDGPRESDASAMAGSYGLARGLVRGMTGLGGGVANAQVAWTNWDGWRAHSDASRLVASAATNVPVGERSRLALAAIATDNEFRIPGPLTQAQLDSAPQQANAVYAARDERRHNRLLRLSAALDHRWSDALGLSATVFAQPKYLQRSERGTFRDFTRYHVGGNVVARGERALDERVHGRLLIGADEAYQDGAILFYNLAPGGTRGDTLRDNKREGANNAGLFAQGELDIGERWGAVLGARYEAIRYHAESYIDPSLNDVKTFSGVVPKLGLNYRAGATHSIYANVGGGIEAPAGNETDPAGTYGQDTIYAINPLLEPIRSTTYEVGTRQLLTVGTGLLRSLQYDAALYYTDVRNEIVPYRGGRFYFTAGRARRTGAELGVSATGAARTRLDLAIALSDNVYTSYTVDSVHYGNPGAIADYSGNKVVGVPPVIYSLGLAWTSPLRVPFTVRAVLEGTSSYNADDANTITVPAHGIVNLTVGLDRPVALGARLGVRGFVTVNNVLDTPYVASAYLNPDVVNGVPVAFEPGLPRHIVLGLSLVGR